MSKREQYEQKTEELLLPIVESHGFELVDVEYVKEAGTWYLRAYIDKPGGISVDDCELVSRAFSDILDEKDYIDDTYIFEGKTLLSDFFKVTDLEEEDYAEITEGAESLAGMLLNLKGDFPKKKEPLVYGRCRFLILDINHHRITSVRVKIMPEDQQ